MLENASQAIACGLERPIAGEQHRSVWLGLMMLDNSVLLCLIYPSFLKGGLYIWTSIQMPRGETNLVYILTLEISFFGDIVFGRFPGKIKCYKSLNVWFKDRQWVVLGSGTLVHNYNTCRC